MNTQKPDSAVRASLGKFAPKLVDLTEDVLFGDIWERRVLRRMAERDVGREPGEGAFREEGRGVNLQNEEFAGLVRRWQAPWRPRLGRSRVGTAVGPSTPMRGEVAP